MITAQAEAGVDGGFYRLLTEFMGTLAGLAWGLPLICLLLGVGLVLTLRLGLLQLRMFGHAIAVISGKYDDPEKSGDITHFQALCAALSATVGVGNIGGVAAAIHMGGPGAIFWMWVAGFFGMATKFATCTLGQKYRKVNPDGSISGGPMYYIEMGLGRRFKWLAILFAVSTVVASFGGGNMVQSSQMAVTASDEVSSLMSEGGFRDFLFTPFFEWAPDLTPFRIFMGLLVACAVGLVIIGGIRRIGQVAAKLVPGMAVLYCGGALLILFRNFDHLPDALTLIVTSAFNPTAATVGSAGGGFLMVLTWGIRRAVFSNEAGLGSAPIAHAAAKTDEPVREGFVAMLGPFIDTLVICTMTALVILVANGEYLGTADLEGALWKEQTDAVLTKSAFQLEISPGFGGFVIALGLVLFAVSTAISWSYYGDRCIEYLLGPRAIVPYRWIFVTFLFMGAVVKIQAVWDFADFTMAAMAFWNLIGVIGLLGVIVSMTRDYMSREHTPYR